jgi:Zn-dependent M28 family amino/carboxypeptidase
MGRDAWNVIATFDAGPTSDIYIICGHYDSISERPSELAPGAEDNATGAAAVIELARVFSKYPKSATLVFATFSGEEQGLVGSKAFVRNLDPATRSRIKAVLNMDMIGYSKDDSEDVLLESSSRYKNLVDQFAAAASLVDGLKYYVTFNPYGSDHMPFIEAGIPAILTIDNDWGDYPSYHRSSDTIDKVSRDMGAAILRMNAGALAGMLD